MRAVEVKKHALHFGNKNFGRIMMAIDDQESEIRKVEAILNTQFSSTKYEEEGDKVGEISISYIIDRSEKADFMAAYKIAKAT